MEAVPGLGKRQYTLPHYIKFSTALRKKARELGDGWDAELVGRALFCCAKCHKHELAIPPAAAEIQSAAVQKSSAAGNADGDGTKKKGAKSRATRGKATKAMPAAKNAPKRKTSAKGRAAKKSRL